MEADGTKPAAWLLKELRMCSSTSEAMRLIDGGGVSLLVEGHWERVTDRKQPIDVADGLTIRAGKKKICRVRIVDQD